MYLRSHHAERTHRRKTIMSYVTMYRTHPVLTARAWQLGRGHRVGAGLRLDAAHTDIVRVGRKTT